MKRQGKFLKWFLMFSVVVTLAVAFGSTTACAKSKDVTKTFADKEKINQMLDDTWYYTWNEFAWNMKKGDKKLVKFSKEKNRKAVIGWYIAKKYSTQQTKKKYVNKASENLFGKATGKKGITAAYITGEGFHKITIKKITQTGKYKYSVVCDYSAVKKINTNKFKKMGTLTLNIKQNKKSSYGYVLTSIKFQKTSGNPSWMNY